MLPQTVKMLLLTANHSLHYILNYLFNQVMEKDPVKFLRATEIWNAMKI